MKKGDTQKKRGGTPLRISGRERAGLLFHLLDRKARKSSLERLSPDERRKLLEGYRSYQKRSRAERASVEMSVLRSLRRPAWPLNLFVGALILFAALLAAHFSLFPDFSNRARINLFTPLLIGAFGPLFAHTLPGYRLRLLFRLPADPTEWIAGFVTLIALLWTLAYIRIEGVSSPLRAAPLTMSIFLIGAITAPLLEEIFFREMIPASFGSAPHLAGHLLSAVLFGIAHLPAGETMGLFYFVAALLLSTLRISSGGLLLPVLVHAIANGVTLFL
jgi:membrane protease YdiL (CAAX protease family)